MARMILHLDIADGAKTETFPIYELDYAAAIAGGITIDGSVNRKSYTQWTPQGSTEQTNIWYARFILDGSNLYRFLSTDIPSQQWQDGNIIKGKLTPYVDEEGVYTPDPSIYEFETFSGTQPDDWGQNPNYFQQRVLSFTYDNTTYTYREYYNTSTGATFSPSTIYYHDKNKAMLKKLYTKAGSYFCTYWGGDDDTSGYGPWLMTSGGDCDGTSTSSRYGICAPNGSAMSVYIGGSSGGRTSAEGYALVTSNSASWRYNALFASDAAFARSMVFIHFKAETEEGVKDFYGPAIIGHDSFAEDARANNLRVWAFTADFWGASIIAGGGGESVWGNDGPISVPQGGNGSWDAPSDNRGDPNGTGTLNIVSDWGSKYNALVATGYHKYHLAIDSSMGINSSTAFKELCTSLWNPSIWSSFQNYFYSPINSILVCHMLPKKLSPILLPSAAQSKIYAANIELTTESVPVFSDLVGHYHVGSVNINNYTDSFADYENTSIYIHLPYIGTKQLDISAVMDGQLAVDYAVDYFSGDIVAYIWTEDYNGNHTYRYTFKGNAAKQIPLAQRVNPGTQLLVQALPAAAGALIGGSAGALIGAGTSLHDLTTSYGGLGVVPSMVKQGALGEALGYVGKDAVAGIKSGAITGVGIGRAAKSAITSGSQTITSNAESGGSATAPTDTQCYLIIQRPIWSAPENYRKLFGYPSDIGGTIEENFEGFLSVRSIKLDDITAATDAEKAEIYQLMATGVYVSDNFGPEE